MKNEKYLITNFYYILKWYFVYDELKKMLLKVILSVSYYTFKCGQQKTQNLTYVACIVFLLDSDP